ncbi:MULTISPECIES: hypothetical protein [Streptomycetaceae]|uniref:Uncharacterized protein n=1 Tax=Streptantibioticus cattleyicolor (strain ATCC 35852 / DSM 46488 / JCM 4925 / NBRC 14057 / NRRL 8057) TaxID=1003195 RepID=F8K0K6_STREN|nr:MULTISPECIES: hypothetical protein [Streptomycetaceae]AEW97412.1 hypothetical protein SCATT_50410 [Streptantibioticus cattleyicolor NRRL 8057 = DSM 46488]MYS61856.1 hypothetical protein [Streptomyces sp. SID5468]CCB77735.1 conserved protein of unknown function [Streptantibioticus cattleyicolor NRRL 8057 = DSM 46488]
MTPPPPWRRMRHADGPALDPALDDTPLATVRDALARGRWAEVRALLAETGEDWDRRGHRLVVLGEGNASAVWAREWQLAEPDSPDAAALLACATVFQAVRGKETPDTARRHCLTAATLAPADPSPWLGLLILARRTGTDDERARAFDQVRARHREHHHAHHLMAACLAEHHEAHDDPLHEVYDFAAWAAEQAPADSPLAVLPVVAHAERYRVLARAGAAAGDPAASGHWTTRRARQVMKAAFDWWLEWGGEDHHHPRHKVDLNYLAHAKYHAGRLAEAATLITRIGPHVTHAPWSYPDRDPAAEFRAAADAALGPG